MTLTITTETTVFDTKSIGRGDCIRLQQTKDTEAVNGLVAQVDKDKLTVFYMPATKNVTNFIVIAADEVGDWYSIRWSPDLEAVYPEAENE